MPTRQTRSPIYDSSDYDANDELTHAQCDVLIIGAGLAGLSTALSLPQHLSITILAKQDLQACSSHYAQGGIAAVIDRDDTVAEHVNDTLIAGDGLCDVEATTQILSQGANAIDWLLKHEVPFTTNAHGENIDTGLTKNAALADLHLTKEGGHGRRRVAHADDATGKHVMQTLHAQALAASHIQVRAYHDALSLITDDGRCVGAIAVNTQTNELIQFNSHAVVLASGGLGQLFDRATAPNVCVGDGMMMAWEAGCRLANLEFIQFHPTGLVHQDENGINSNFLISEAVRGEGGYLYCPISKQRFMPAYDSREELAPRDIVARAIANEIVNNGLGYVHLDISHKPALFIREHFPDIYAHCLTLGIDITTDPIPVAPTAHYTCGGIMASAQGQTDVKGLYAAGEVANTGLHGANRLASNSLLECVVVGRAIAKQLPDYFAGLKLAGLKLAGLKQDCLIDSQDAQANPQVSVNLDSNQAQFQVSLEPLLGTINSKSDMFSTTVAPVKMPATKKLVELTDAELNQKMSELKKLMTNQMGIRRSECQLKQALQQVLSWQSQSQHPIESDYRPNTPTLGHDKSTILNGLRWQRLLTLATLLLQSAITRVESRGGHCRNDYPDTADTAAISVVAPISQSIDYGLHSLLQALDQPHADVELEANLLAV
ncbi:L-aspartate oxidase [Psychrobacter sp. FDAARGOS_221]|uniref:L-aspartate oxidase n=1 Tax=Psychrobacter sp. FDAARGOS_221 TaxID=1975705 RepID=UPI000BB53552|nr:L-aspartate oxidase [Psychrobacter sp. FDAARGOS_221]PNK61208.1 L-aspartate oxidase [Psychrobacter sp. FDAARGOS_221]